MFNIEPFGITSHDETYYIMKNFIWKDINHVKVHLIKTRYNIAMQCPNMTTMFAKILCSACDISGESPCLVELTKLIHFVVQRR